MSGIKTCHCRLGVCSVLYKNNRASAALAKAMAYATAEVTPLEKSVGTNILLIGFMTVMTDKVAVLD